MRKKIITWSPSLTIILFAMHYNTADKSRLSYYLSAFIKEYVKDPVDTTRNKMNIATTRSRLFHLSN